MTILNHPLYDDMLLIVSDLTRFIQYSLLVLIKRMKCIHNLVLNIYLWCLLLIINLVSGFYQYYWDSQLLTHQCLNSVTHGFLPLIPLAVSTLGVLLYSYIIIWIAYMFTWSGLQAGILSYNQNVCSIDTFYDKKLSITFSVKEIYNVHKNSKD